MKLVKTERRTGLEPAILSALCYNSFNVPSLHQMDFEACIEMWRNDVRAMGVYKRSTEQGDSGDSKVVVRLRTESKRAFLFTSGSPYTA